MQFIRVDVGDLLTDTEGIAVRTTAGNGARIIEEMESRWAFIDPKGMEPTENLAERAVRHPVIWRRIIHGTQGDKGNPFG